MKRSHSPKFLISALLAALISAGCHPSPLSLTLISGKTVYGNLALEDVHIKIYNWEHSRRQYFSDTRSGYHGSFRVHLPPGVYSLQASTMLRVGQNEVLLTGALEELVVREAERRMDQVVIHMVQASGT